jgi:hypothetical protein
MGINDDSSRGKALKRKRSVLRRQGAALALETLLKFQHLPRELIDFRSVS